jgi:adenylylsulfate kinase
MYSESHVRSVAKAVSWRMLGTITTSVLVFIFTRRLALSLAVGALEFTSKIGLFWLHERVWDRIRLGRRRIRPAVLWFTGLSGSGKSTISAKVADELHSRGFEVEQLDGDTIRNIFPQTGFTRAERDAHVRRVGYVASRLEKHGTFVVASLISPYDESRRFVRELCDNFIEIHVATPLEECERRDPKGLYARARRGEITGFTGIDDPYEIPSNPELTLDTRHMSLEEAAAAVLKRLEQTIRRKPKHGSPERNRSAEHLHSAGSVRELQTVGDAVVDREG